MSKRRFPGEQIIDKLWEAEISQSKGQNTVVEDDKNIID